MMYKRVQGIGKGKYMCVSRIRLNVRYMCGRFITTLKSDFTRSDSIFSAPRKYIYGPRIPKIFLCARGLCEVATSANNT